MLAWDKTITGTVIIVLKLNLVKRIYMQILTFKMKPSFLKWKSN